MDTLALFMMESLAWVNQRQSFQLARASKGAEYRDWKLEGWLIGYWDIIMSHMTDILFHPGAHELPAIKKHRLCIMMLLPKVFTHRRTSTLRSWHGNAGRKTGVPTNVTTIIGRKTQLASIAEKEEHFLSWDLCFSCLRPRLVL